MSQVDEFLSNLIRTNRSHLFYVDWDKARAYQEQYKDELALLQVLTLENSKPEEELARLLRSYPRINKLIPLLIATRIKAQKGGTANLTILDEDKVTNLEYNFSDAGLTEKDILASVEFAKKTGLLKELTLINNHADYYLGVEVGSDTNARKNRSGKAMEALVEEYVQGLADKYGGQMLAQTTFAKAGQAFGVEVPPHQDNKKGDFMLYVKGKAYNIETNYFDDSGSKQEIMNSYISRAEDLQKAGWGFALVTDGAGWLQGKRQLEEGYERIKYIYNIKMCNEGALEDLVSS